jgi:hypothetical protein
MMRAALTKTEDAALGALTTGAVTAFGAAATGAATGVLTITGAATGTAATGAATGGEGRGVPIMQNCLVLASVHVSFTVIRAIRVSDGSSQKRCLKLQS